MRVEALVEPRRTRWRGRVLAAGAVIVLAVIGTWQLVKGRDPIYDDRKVIERLVSGAATIDIPADVTLPESTATAPLDPKDLVLVVSKRSVRVPLSGFTLDLPPDASHGLDARHKRNGPNDLYITELGSILSWARDQLRQEHLARGDADESRLIVLADRDAPYRLIVEVLFTAGETEWTHFVFAVRNGGALAGVTNTPPKVMGAGGARWGGRDFVVLVVDDGFSITRGGWNIAPGCKDMGPGLAIGKSSLDYDYGALRRCIVWFKTVLPHPTETATLSANPQIPFQVVISTMDALRQSDTGDELFPDVNLGVAK